MLRFMIELEREEAEALAQSARYDKRDARNQAALFIRRELERAGLLPIAPRAGQGERACEEMAACGK